MAATGTAPIQIALEPASGSGAAATHSLLAAMLRATDKVSDLIFSPGRPPQVEVFGQLIPVEGPGLRPLTADDTRRIASDLIGSNKQAITILREQGSCDISFGLPGLARFRVNIFIQRGSCAVVMRVIPTTIPEFSALGLPPQLGEIASLRDGIVMVTGARGSGKSSTLAALLDCINDKTELPHHHHRRSYRVLAQSQERYHSSAGTSQRHAELCPGIACGLAAGAKGDPRRRTARPGNHGDGS